jgi:N-methylhydantoinase B
MPYSVRGALSVYPAETLKPGDVLFHNDPGFGNTHLPDCLMVMPIFAGDILLGFSAVRGHWTDIGGVVPGSYSTNNSELLQEGVIIPPVKLYSGGVLDDALARLILANVRNPELRRSDIDSQFAGCFRGATQVREIARRFGTQETIDAMASIQHYAEQLTRLEIEKIPDGTYIAEEYTDGDGSATEPLKIKVRITIEGSKATVDFAETAPQQKGGINAPIAVTVSATHYAMKCLTDPWNAPNSGSYRPVEIIAPLGSLVNPLPGAPVVAGNHETASLIASAIIAALAPVRTANAVAPGSASSGVVAIGGKRANGKAFVFHEPTGGAWGARSNADGISVFRDGVGNTGLHSAEVIETEYPIRIVRQEIAEGTGGAGKHRGGLALRRGYELLTDAIVTIVGERQMHAAVGLDGGHPGSNSRYRRILPTGDVLDLKSKTPGVPMERGTVVEAQAGGGGGWGDPLERDRTAIERDLTFGLITLDQAETQYAHKVSKEEN